MVLREIEMFATSTPLHRDDSRISTFDRLFSPLSAKRDEFSTPRRSNSGFLCNTTVRRQLRPLCSPFSKMTRHTRDLTNSLSSYPVSKGSRFPSTPVSHQDYVRKTRRSANLPYSSLDASQDSGLGSSFSSSSSFYEPIFSPEWDILRELNKINCYEVTSQLLSYLSPKDIQTVSSVSKTWRAIVLDNAAANKRRCELLIQKMLHSKENKSTAKPKRTTEDRVLFQVIANKQSSLPKKPLEDNTTTNVFRSFVELGKNLHMKDILLKCPKCNHPSKKHLDNKYCCTRQFCAYEFCCQCCGPFLTNHSCDRPSFNEALPKVLIGSQKSKRSLRRL